MTGNWYLWLVVFTILLAAFALCMKTAKNRRKYWIYFVSGMLLGFYFDIISFTNGYYSYSSAFPITIFGLPLTMTIAEGFSVAILMRIFEITKDFLKKQKIWRST